ncbi:MAG: hypothetical protein HUU21_22410 [Polyangiaceae bacterium]|nr:hypothetical protein [Polyangiaceae bacterium]
MRPAETLALLLVLAILVAVPVLLVVAIVLWAINQQKQRDAAWERVARRLGLEYANRVVYGLLNGQQVSLRTETRGSGKSRQTYTVVSSMPPQWLDLGLQVTTKGFFDDALASLGLKRNIKIGDPGFDAAFSISADEPHRAAALLTPELRHALSGITEPVVLTDSGFSMSTSGVIDDEKWLVWALRAAANVAAQMAQARRRVPPASSLMEHRAEWKRFAEATGLSRTSTPFCMWGDLEGTRISARAVRVGPLAYQMEVQVFFDLPLHMRMFVRPAGALDDLAAFFGREDHRLNDPVFDPAFVVQSARPERLPEVLDEGVRRLLLDLNRRFGSVQVTDEGISLRNTSMAADPRGIPALVGHLREAAQRITENAAGKSAGRAGPYR